MGLRRRAALRRANQARSQRSEIKPARRAGELRVAELLGGPPESLRTARPAAIRQEDPGTASSPVVVLYTCPFGNHDAPLHVCGKTDQAADRGEQKRRSPCTSAPALSPQQQRSRECSSGKQPQRGDWHMPFHAQPRGRQGSTLRLVVWEDRPWRPSSHRRRRGSHRETGRSSRLRTMVQARAWAVATFWTRKVVLESGADGGGVRLAWLPAPAIVVSQVIASPSPATPHSPSSSSRQYSRRKNGSAKRSHDPPDCSSGRPSGSRPGSTSS